MALGNSKGQNKGKVYLKDKSNIDNVFAEQAVSFQKWFSRQYTQLQSELINKEVYDEDIINETFLKIYDIVLFSGLDIQCYKSYFHRSYYTNYRAKKINISKCLEESIDSETLISEDISTETNTPNILFEAFDKILNYRESELMKILYKNNDLTIKAVAKIIDIPYHTACYIMRRAKAKLRQQSPFLSLFN